MNTLTRRAVKYCSLFLIITIPAFCYFRQAYQYLCLTRFSNPDILVVEGWLQPDALMKAKAEFLNKPYNMILTTGLPYFDGFQMGSFGKMVFSMNKRLLTSPDSTYSISLLIRGTKAQGEFAHFILYADTLRLGDFYSSRRKKQYNQVAKLDKPPEIIRVEFDNDTYTKYKDRDLYFYSVTVNDQIFPANNENVAYFEHSNGVYYFRQCLSNSTATNAAQYLRDTGIPDSLVFPIETLHVKKSKTYTTALDVKYWIDMERPSKRPSVQIFTRGTHARRTYLSFVKAFGDSADIGVISCPDNEITPANWWKSLKGWKKILYETAGVLYALIVL